MKAIYASQFGHGAGMGMATVLQPEIWRPNMHGVQKLTTYSSIHANIWAIAMT